MPENSFYQAPLQVNGYVNPEIAPVPQRPVDLYGMFNITPKTTNVKQPSPYELLMAGHDPSFGSIPDISPIRTSMETIKPLDDAAGLFHSQDGYGKYGYSSILNNGDNEDRYSSNFRRDNPAKFFDQPGWHPLNGLYKLGYWGGGFLEKTLESAIVKTGQGLAGLYGLTKGAITNGIVGNIEDSISGRNDHSFADWLTGATDNIFSNAFNGWDENLKARYHYFQEKADRDKKGFIQSLSDGDFWMNDISDGLSFMASAAFEVGLISKLGLGAKLATKINPLAEGVSTEALAAGASKTGLVTKALNALGAEGSGAKLFQNAVDMSSQTLVTTAIESAVEAQQTKDDVYNSFAGKLNPETGNLYTDDERKRLAAGAAAEVFKQNMAILVGPKFLETLVFNRIGSAIKGAFSKAASEAEVAAGQASENVKIGSRLGTIEKGVGTNTSYSKLSALDKIIKLGSLAGTGFLSEGLFEENIQQAIQTSATNLFGAGESYRPEATGKNIDKLGEQDELFGDVGNLYLKQTKQFFKGIFDDRYIDDQLSKSIGIGGLFGVGGGLIHGSIGMRQQAKVDHYWVDRLNQANVNLFQTNNFYKTKEQNVPDPQDPGKTVLKQVPVVDDNGNPVIDNDKVKSYLNSINNIRGLMEVINNTEDPEDENNKAEQNQMLNKLARNVLFSKLAMEYIRAGKKDQLIANLNSVKNFSDEDIQALGYDPSNMKPEEKESILKNLIKTVERLDKANEWIENNVIDNVSERGEKLAGLRYSKTQKERIQQNFEAKKAYLRELAQRNAIMDGYLDDVNKTEQDLDSQQQKLSNAINEAISKAFEDQGIQDVNQIHEVRQLNAKIPAINNHLEVLKQELAYHFDKLANNEKFIRSFSKKIKSRNRVQKTRMRFHHVKFIETLDKIHDLESQIKEVKGQKSKFLSENEDYDHQLIDGNMFILHKDDIERVSNNAKSLEEINIEKRRRLNDIKREEINIEKNWINDEWKNTAALKEEKENQGREGTRFSRRMTGSTNAYNQYFEREVLPRDDSEGKPKLKLYHKEQSKRIEHKKYTHNEEKLLKRERIRGKVAEILADTNGKDLMAQLDNVLNKNLHGESLSSELKNISNQFNGKPLTIDEKDKHILDSHLSELEDERDFLITLNEQYPEDDRFNDKYYDVDDEGNYQIKPEYDDPFKVARATSEIDKQIDDITKVKQFLDKIPEEIKGDWNNLDFIRKNIADQYLETANNYIDTYNILSNNGASEVYGDSFSTKQELDQVEDEINELGQLKKIFSERPDSVLSAPEFKNFVENLDKKIEDLKNIKKVIEERLSSRLRENHDFLIDTVNNSTEQLGVNMDGEITNQPIHDIIEKVVSTEVFLKLKDSLNNLKELLSSEKPDNKEIEKSYWNINGQIAGITQLLKEQSSIERINSEINFQKDKLISQARETNLAKTKDINEVVSNLKDSVLGSLQTLFYTNGLFTYIGNSEDPNRNFLDDTPSSPVFKFREDYNLRKLIRGVENDNARTDENTEVSKEDLLEFLNVARKIKDLEDLSNAVNSDLNLLNQIETEKKIVEKKTEKKDNQYEDVIIPSIQQVFFLRDVVNFLKLRTIKDANKIGFRNWAFIQAPGGAGKTQSLGTWFGFISKIPRDRIIASAYTEAAARGMQKALLLGEDNPKDVNDTIQRFKDLITKGDYSQEVLIMDEFPAISFEQQKELFKVVSEYTKNKLEKTGEEFKVITLGDTNQLTFSGDSVIPTSGIIVNRESFNDNKDKTAENENHIAKMHIIPSLTVNFRSNLFTVVSFADKFRGSVKSNVNEHMETASTDPSLESKNVKGVVSVNKSDFKSKLISYLKLNQDSTRTKTLIVNESKIESYRKLLSDNGINVITDPNDEQTKGVYLSTVKNVQGFSFDEVFIDLDNKDKMFSNTSSPNLVYNKAMYVAASRARDLIVVTNFSNFRNVTDSGINDLESKSLSELQTKDSEFKSDRDNEIAGAKNILGDQYENNTKIINLPEKDEDEEDEENPSLNTEEQAAEEKKEEESEEIEEIKSQEPVVDKQPEGQSEKIPEKQEEPEDEEDQFDDEENEIVETSDGLDSTEEREDENISEDPKEEITKLKDKIIGGIKDTTNTVFDKIRDSVVNLLFPTAHAIKYKVKDNEFRIKSRLKEGEEYQYRGLQEGDKIQLIPFIPNKSAKKDETSRKFGYALVAPAIDADGEEIENEYRTVAILSNKEIDKLKDKDTFNKIVEQEKKDADFVSITYNDIADRNGFTTSGNKVLDVISEGKVSQANTVKYFYSKNNFRNLTKEEFEGNMSKDSLQGNINGIINDFIDNYYANRIAQDKEFKEVLRKFYKDPQNAKIVIITTEDMKKNRVSSPEDYTLKPGVPYIMFKPFDGKSAPQYITISRRYLNNTLHTEVTSPIQEFINLGKEVKKFLKKKKIEGAIGYSSTTAKILSMLSSEYLKNPDPENNNYEITINRGKESEKTYKFSVLEAEKVHQFYSLFSSQSEVQGKAVNEKEIKALIRIDKKTGKNTIRPRKLMLDDDTVIKGTVESYDEKTKTFTIKDATTGEVTGPISGTIRFAGKVVRGKAQKALDDIMNSNGHISRHFITKNKIVNFVTDRSRAINTKDGAFGYKFMNLVGSKKFPVVKEISEDGNVISYYEDVIDILENLFNFAKRGELPEKALSYYDHGSKTIKQQKVKFRVPVPLSSKTETGYTNFDYTVTNNNTSRTNTEYNSAFFETNFEGLVPTNINVEFSKEIQEPESKIEVSPEVKEKAKTKESNIEVAFTKEQLMKLPFRELRDQFSEEQKERLASQVKEGGWESLDQFFDEADEYPDVEELYRNEIINCML